MQQQIAANWQALYKKVYGGSAYGLIEGRREFRSSTASGPPPTPGLPPLRQPRVGEPTDEKEWALSTSVGSHEGWASVRTPVLRHGHCRGFLRSGPSVEDRAGIAGRPYKRKRIPFSGQAGRLAHTEY